MRLEDYAPVLLIIFMFLMGFIAGGSTYKEVGAIAVYENRIVCEKALDEWVCREALDD